MSFRLTQFRIYLLIFTLGHWIAVGRATSTPTPEADLVQTNAENHAPEKTIEVVAVTTLDPAAEKFWQAVKLLESKQADEVITGRKFLVDSSDHEYTHAQVLLGNCLISGSYGFAKDPRKAVNLFRLAAERNNAFAKVSLGTCYATGTGLRKDEAKAAEWLTGALAEHADFSRPIPPVDFAQDPDRPGGEVAGELANDPVSSSQASAHFLLGQILTRQNKLAEAQAHLVAAASVGPDGRSGIYQAAVDAAVNYAFGRGTARDPAKATELLQQSRRLGARAGVSLIHNYVSLKIVDEFAVADLEEEVKEAGAGYESAVQVQIAQTLADKKSKDYNVAEAVRWYELAAENEQAWAMLSLAFIYAHGDLGQPDPAKAFFWFEKVGGGEKPKHILGVTNLAICLQQGLGTSKDEARAAELFKKNRSNDFICYLGTIGQAPTKAVTAEEDLQINQRWATEKNDAQAQFVLGLRYLSGFGVTANVEQSAHWLKKAAKAKHGEALCLLGWLYQVHPQQYGFRDPEKAARAATECYKVAGEVGSVDGLANYANSLNSGFGVEKNVAKAIATYNECLKIDPNHSRSHSNLAAIYNYKLIVAADEGVSFGTVEWKTEMLDHYEKSMRQAVPFGAIGLGDLYYEGRFVPRDLNKAYAYFEQATTVPTNKAAAHYRLGYMHEFGQGVPVTYTEAAYHYRLASLEGNVPALRRLVDFYITGTGVSLDFDRAAYWLNYMVQLGQADALPTMADVLLKKHDYEHAVKLLNSLINSSNRAISGFAYERLSQCYRAGQGVEKNPKRAEKYLLVAVELGNGNAVTTVAHRQIARGEIKEGIVNLTWAAKTSDVAAFNLGQMYFFGTNVTQDRPKGLDYLKQASEKNNSDAQYFLAGLTWNHDPDAPVLDVAISLAQKAENLGNAKAADLREKLEKRRKAGTDTPEENTRTRSS